MGCAAVPLMQTSRVTHRFTLAWDTTASLLSEPDQLPFAANQFDVIVLPHTLSFRPCHTKCCAKCFVCCVRRDGC
jgi:hypothetical protein